MLEPAVLIKSAVSAGLLTQITFFICPLFIYLTYHFFLSLCIQNSSSHFKSLSHLRKLSQTFSVSFFVFHTTLSSPPARNRDAANQKAPLKAEEMGGEKALENSQELFLPHLLQSCRRASEPCILRAQTEETLC